MDVTKGTNAKYKRRNVEAPSAISEAVTAVSEDAFDAAEANRSVRAMKKMYSIDRIAFNMSETKFDGENRSSDKLAKFRTSSTNLERDHALTETKASSRSSFGDHRLRKSGNDLFLLDILEMKKYSLASYIQENPKAADLKWSLFCAACHSYRYDSVLRPFPPMFMHNDIKDIEKLRDTAESCPTINVLFEQTQERTSSMLSAELVNLLYWVLIHRREPQLKLLARDSHRGVLSKVVSSSTAVVPHYIFQVQYNRHADQEKFNDLAKKYKTIHAFHGSRLDNFYSILYHGLRISFNKHNAYGPGIYVSTEMNVSLPHSPTGFSWGGSYFGSQISIVALCEMIDHPGVKYTDDSLRKKRRNLMTDLDGISENVFVVPDTDLIRVKYLLIYCGNLPDPNTKQLSTIATWFHKNKVLAVVIAYVFLLMAIATANNSTLHKYYRRFARKLGSNVVNI